MTSMNYHHCEMCDSKTFYDAEINYNGCTVVSLCSDCNKIYEIKINKIIPDQKVNENES
jgi:ribosome-binding protein aMBF1 (putative translation factor)